MAGVVRVALIAGPQYDQVEAVLAGAASATGVTVEVGFRGDHPSLNRHLAETLGAGAYDLVSTHGKYVPSQSAGLLPADGLIDESAFAPRALELCRFEGALLCVPRCIDVRLLWGRIDLVGEALPTRWDDLIATAGDVAVEGVAGYAFPGRGSGLFGTFAELAAAHGDELFDAGAPTFLGDGCHAALGLLVDAHRRRRVTPADLLDHGYDQVAHALRAGLVALAGDWPAYFSALDASPVRDRLTVARYPRGPAGRSAYAGCHGWAITSTARDPHAAAEVLRHLTSPAAAANDAAQGMVPARLDVTLPAPDALAERRRALLATTIAEDLLTFPALARFPLLEDAAAEALRAALRGDVEPATALTRLQRTAETVLGAVA